MVKNPYNCVVECSACAKLCPEGAIRFPDEVTFAAFIKDRIVRHAMES